MRHSAASCCCRQNSSKRPPALSNWSTAPSSTTLPLSRKRTRSAWRMLANRCATITRVRDCGSAVSASTTAASFSVSNALVASSTSAQLRDGLLGVRPHGAALARPCEAHRGRRTGRRTPSRGGVTSRGTRRAGRNLGRLPDTTRTGASHLTVGAGGGGVGPRFAGLRYRARPAVPTGRACHPGTRRRVVAHHAERATPARPPGEHPSPYSTPPGQSSSPTRRTTR